MVWGEIVVKVPHGKVEVAVSREWFLGEYPAAYRAPNYRSQREMEGVGDEKPDCISSWSRSSSGTAHGARCRLLRRSEPDVSTWALGSEKGETGVIDIPYRLLDCSGS